MWYFAYGSNLNARAVADWCRHYGHRAPQMKGGKPSVLDNYRLCFPIFSEYWGGGIGDIVYDPGKYVSGALYDLSEADMKTLDAKVGRKLEGERKPASTSASTSESPLWAKVNRSRPSPIRASTSKISHPADPELHGPADSGRLQPRAVDDVDRLSSEFQHASRQEAEAARVWRFAGEAVSRAKDQGGEVDKVTR